MRLKDIMQTKVITIGPDATAARARSLMEVRGVHHLVVTDARKVVGMVSARDMGRGTPDTARVADVMHRTVVSARPDATVRQAANLMRGRSVGSLAVLEGSKLSGIVTVSDLLELLGRGADHAVEKRRRWTLKHRGTGPRLHA
jgi:acetoin utilization protein AcuB